VMKPNPFSELNHFTVPVAIAIPPSFAVRAHPWSCSSGAGVTSAGVRELLVANRDLYPRW
jgi:hypothetical protein